jgi:glycosyltransferase involved in cell wall biosynthesis
MNGLDAKEFRQSLMRGELGEGEGDYFSTIGGSPLDLEIFDIPHLGRRVSLFGDFRALSALVRALRQIRPDIVHTHMAKAGALGRIAAFLARVPIRIHTYHGHLLQGYFGRGKTLVVILAERLLRMFTTFTIVVGEQVRQDLIDANIVSADKSCSISPSVETIALMSKEQACDQLGLPHQRQIVIFVGRLTSIKRPDLFVDLAHKLADAGSDALCVFVGDGPLGGELRVANIAQDNLLFLGWQHDLSAVYSAADVVVLCSDNEGMPLSLIEASLCNKAIVATDVGSVREIVNNGKTGILVKPNDAAALHAAVAQYLSDPDLRQHSGEQARSFALASFLPEHALRAHSALYRRLQTGS